MPAETCLRNRGNSTKALKQAVRLGLIPRNPADAVDPPRVAKHEVNCYSKDEVLELLEAARDTWLYIPVLLAVSTGMRRGEVLGL